MTELTPIVEQISALFAREEAERQPPYGQALDLGCGSGIWAVKLAARGWQVAGRGRRPEGPSQGAQRAQEAGVEVRLIEGDVTALRATGVGSDFRFLLDFGLFHDELDGRAARGDGSRGERGRRARRHDADAGVGARGAGGCCRVARAAATSKRPTPRGR